MLTTGAHIARLTRLGSAPRRGLWASSEPGQIQEKQSIV
jgi:hypothetical protein